MENSLSFTSDRHGGINVLKVIDSINDRRYLRVLFQISRPSLRSRKARAAESLSYRVSSKRGTENKRRSPYQGCSIGTVPFTLLGQPRPIIGGTRQHSCVLAGLHAMSEWERERERECMCVWEREWENKRTRFTIRKFVRTSVANRKPEQYLQHYDYIIEYQACQEYNSICRYLTIQKHTADSSFSN